MDAKQVIIRRVSDLITLASQTLAFASTDSFESSKARLRSQSLQFIKDLNGTSDPNYSEFETKSRHSSLNAVVNCRAILEGIKHDIENDYYLSSIKGLVSAEIFSDYLEMADYLLGGDWFIPAAVIVGSTLEAHLKKLCQKNNIPIDKTNSNGKTTVKQGSELNADLYKGNIYNKIAWSLVDSWQKIRNDASHGNFEEFNQAQIINMLGGVKEFIGRNPI